MANTKPSLTFFDMPAEIRNQIYMHHLCSSDPIELPYAYEHKHFIEPALLSAHPIIRREAMPIYYGCNTFETPSPASAHYFLSQLSPQCISLIRQFRPLDLILPATQRERFFEGLRTNLNRLIARFAKGALPPEAVCVPIRRGDGGVDWWKVNEIQEFEVKRADAGCWTVEWKTGVPAT